MINKANIIQQKKVLWRRLINIALILLVVFFVSRFFYKQWGSIVSGPAVKINWLSLLFGVCIYECYWFYQICHWRRIMRVLGTRLSFLNASFFFFTNCLLAYIPGKVSNVIGMSSLAKKTSVSKMQTVTTVVLFQIYAVISGVLVISAFWYFSSQKIQAVISHGWIMILWFAAIAGIVCISPHFIQFTLGVLRKFLKKDIEDISLPFKYHIVHLTIYFCSWIILGSAMLFLANSFGIELPYTAVVNVTLIFVASYLIGLLAITLPSGLGLVELGLLYGFSVLYSPKQAIFAAIAFRLTALFTTIASYLVLLYLRKKAK